MTKTVSDDPVIDTAPLGLALCFAKPTTDDRWSVRFDTGVILYVPDMLFPCMVFHMLNSDKPLQPGQGHVTL